MEPLPEWWQQEGWRVALAMRNYIDGLPMEIQRDYSFKAGMEAWLAALNGLTQRRLRELGWEDD